MDIQVPKTGGRKPLVVFLSGGGFVVSDQASSLDQRTYVADHGYVVASVQYRTTLDGATYKDGVADVKSAIRYLRAHAAEYHINPGKVAVSGESAGGYLAAMTGTTNGLRQFDTGADLSQSSRVQAVIDQFGPSDLSRIAAGFDTATQQIDYAPGNFAAQYVFGPGTTKSVLDDPAAVAAADPISYVNSATPPFVLFHGSDDHLVSADQTLLMLHALRAKGIHATRYVVKGANHGGLGRDPRPHPGQHRVRPAVDHPEGHDPHHRLPAPLPRQLTSPVRPGCDLAAGGHDKNAAEREHRAVGRGRVRVVDSLCVFAEELRSPFRRQCRQHRAQAGAPVPLKHRIVPMKDVQVRGLPRVDAAARPCEQVDIGRRVPGLAVQADITEQ
jgi:acetyl esterase/lipase